MAYRLNTEINLRAANIPQFKKAIERDLGTLNVQIGSSAPLSKLNKQFAQLDRTGSKAVFTLSNN